MKIKSRAVRRNSSGYRLQEDEPVSAKGKVDDAPPLPSHVSYSLGGVAVGRFLDGYRVSTMPPSVSNECTSVVVYAPLFLYVDMLLFYGINFFSDVVAVGTSPVYCNAGPSAQGSVASDAHVPFDVIAPHHVGCLVSDYPFTMPAGVPSADGASSSCYPSFAAAGVSLNSGMPTASAPVPFVEPCEEFTVSDVRYTVPLNMASGSSANTSCTGAIGPHQPVAGSGSHDAAPIPTSARACRRPRPCTGPRARERRVPAGSAVPPRNAPGTPFIAGVNCCF